MISRQFYLLKNIYKGNCVPLYIGKNSFYVFGTSVSRRTLFTLKPRQTLKLTSCCRNLSQTYQNWFSNSILDGDVTELQRNQVEKELTNIKKLFPNPRVTLHNFAAKTPQKIYDVIFKQSAVTLKGAKKKSPQTNSEWICTYAFVWPEIKKIECKAVSKRQAAEKASINALHWLYILKRIDNKGDPIYDRGVLQELRSTLNEPFKIEVTQNSIEKVENIYKHYVDRIKPLFEATFKEAEEETLLSATVLNKDSTIDEEDELANEDVLETDDDLTEQKIRVHPVYGKVIKAPAKTTLERRQRILNRSFQYYDSNATPLPIDEYSTQIASALQNSRVLIVVGAAGCGKSTRAPAAILRSFGAKTAILVSEPRRVAAIGLADRVASELGEDVGETVGYQVRLKSRLPKPPTGSILYCTSGVLLRRLQSNPGLEGCTHVFIDEAHERDVNTDVTLLLLKRALKLNSDLRVVVMSATLDVAVFNRYFDDCPIVEVPGRTYPVSVTHLDKIEKIFNLKLPYMTENCKKEGGRPLVNCHEVVEVIKSIDRTQPEGAILVFLPGWAEIKRAMNLLEETYKHSGTHIILPVHSRLSTSDQTRMFAKAPAGTRKIVLSTNIAETSVTVPDVIYVVDTGAQKINTITQGSGTSSLESSWVSAAAAKQRTGRAGRVQPGHCYRLYTKERQDEFEPHMTPEILRVPLDQTVLELKSFVPDGTILDFLSQLPEPPSETAVKWAVDDLVAIGAFTPTEKLTRLGVILSSLTLRPRLGLTLLHSRAVGNMAAVSGVLPINGSIFNLGDNSEIREFKKKYSQTSDHSAINWILTEYEETLKEKGPEEAENWCQKHGLRRDKLRYLRAITNLHLGQLLKSQLISDADELNSFSHIDELTAAIVLSAGDSMLVTRKYIRSKGKLKTAVDVFKTTGERAHIGSESVNYGIIKRGKEPKLLAYYGGYHSTDRRALVVHTTSLVPPHTPLLFCMGDVQSEVLENDNETTVLTLPRHKLSVHIPTSQAPTILKTREMLQNMLSYYILRDTKTMNYDDDAAASKFKTALVKAVARVLIEANKS